MRNRRTVLPVLCAVLAVVSLLLVGCGGSDFSSSDGQSIRDDVSSRLDELKSGSGDSVQLVEDTLSGYVGSQLDDMGLSASDVVTTYLQGFDYELGDVTGSGGSATCKVKLTCRSVTEIMAEGLERVRCRCRAAPVHLGRTARERGGRRLLPEGLRRYMELS